MEDIMLSIPVGISPLVKNTSSSVTPSKVENAHATLVSHVSKLHSAYNAVTLVNLFMAFIVAVLSFVLDCDSGYVQNVLRSFSICVVIFTAALIATRIPHVIRRCASLAILLGVHISGLVTDPEHVDILSNHIHQTLSTTNILGLTTPALHDDDVDMNAINIEKERTNLNTESGLSRMI